MALPLPDKPSIAVLAFTNMSGDPQQEFFSDGITEGIITALASVPELFVIARNSTFTYKGKPVKVRQVAEDLGVRYVLEGSIQASGESVRITAQLIDALTGRHVWADSFDRKLENIFALQDEITMKVITELRVKLGGGEHKRSDQPCTTNLKAYLKYLEATKYLNKWNKEDNLLAQRLAEEAIALEPQYACAFSLLGATHLAEVALGRSASPKQSIAKAKEHIDKAISLNPSLSGPHSNLAVIYRMTGQHDKAVEQAEKALAIAPVSLFSLRELGDCLRIAGRCQEAIPMYEKVIRHDPFSTSHHYKLGICYLYTSRLDDAIRICKEAIERNPKDLFAHLTLVSAYSAAGREAQARATAKEVLRIDPKFSVETYSKAFPYKVKEEQELFIGGLRKAGLN
jgi:adenylate cyclase